MNLHGFLSNFRYVAEAPNGVNRLREMILHFAVSGALVEQVAAEGFSEDDISEVEELGEQYRQRIKVRKGRVHGPIRIEEKPFPIPKSWQWVRLERIACYIQRGKSPIYSHQGRCRVVSQKCIQWSGFDLTPARHIRDDSLDRYGEERFLLEKDVLWNSTGTGTAGRVAVLPAEVSLVVADSHVTVIRLTNFDAKFLWCYLASPIIQARTQPGYEQSLVSGTTNQVELSTTKVAELPIPCPPVAEQQRIVAKVAELMALCDELEAQQHERKFSFPEVSRACHAAFLQRPDQPRLDSILAGISPVDPHELRRSILSLAVSGSLSERGPDDTRGDQVFDALRSISSMQGRAPSSWKRCRYRDVTSLVTSGSRGWKRYFSHSGAIFVRTQNIKTDALVLDDLEYVNLPYQTEGKRTRIEKHDILITITGANVTKCALVTQDIGEAYVSQHIALTRPISIQLSRWLHLCLLSPAAGRGALESMAYGDKPGLNLTNIRDLVFPIPPIAEQKRIVAKVDTLMKLVDLLEDQQSRMLRMAEDFAYAAVAAITGTSTQEPAQMKARKTELVTRLQADRTPDPSDEAPLATLLAENDGALPAKALWQRSGLAIDTFYQQLKTEMARGWIVEPEPAAMREVAAD